ncbi:universal stress protein [Spirosoma litoris]
MKTIIVPTDLSADTEAALSVAVDLARTYPARILLLHSVVYPFPVAAFPEATILTANRTLDDDRQIEQEAKRALERLASNSNYKGIAIIPTLLATGQDLAHSITDQPADLIVMRSSGTVGLEELLIGSNAETVVRHAHCPVLIIKEPVAHFRPENIVCAIDVDDRLKAIQHYPFQMGEQGLHQFLYIHTPTDSRVPEGIRDWVNEFASAKGITEFDCIIRPGKDISSGIIDYANEVNADLIVLFTNGHTGLRHWIEGSVAEDVLNHSTKPVLVMRV